jgi:hypothetical protein
MSQEIREAIGVFDDLESLDAAVLELEATEFPRHDISVIGSDRDLETKFGTKRVKTTRLEGSDKTPRMVSIRPEEKTIGAAALIGVPAYVGGCVAALGVNPASNAVLLSAVLGGSLIGAAIGGVSLLFLWHVFNSKTARQIRDGGLILWVRTDGSTKEESAKKILRRHNAKHVRIQSIS